MLPLGTILPIILVLKLPNVLINRGENKLYSLGKFLLGSFHAASLGQIIFIYLHNR